MLPGRQIQERKGGSLSTFIAFLQLFIISYTTLELWQKGLTNKARCTVSKLPSVENWLSQTSHFSSWASRAQ